VDVVEVEPTPTNNPLLDMPNALVTPHVAGTSTGSTRRILEFTAENLRRFAAGKTPESLIKVQD